MNDACIFCKIARGDIPSTRVYEDEDAIAFMDIGPIVKGHTLVIPRRHYDPIMETPDEVLAKLITVAKKIARAQQKTLKADGVNILQANGAAAGQQVPHIHFHVIPRFKTDGHHWNWAAKKYDSLDEMKDLAGRIRAGLEMEGAF